MYRILKNTIFGLDSIHTKKKEKKEKIKYISVGGIMSMDDY
jgi:hypothetical protein